MQRIIAVCVTVIVFFAFAGVVQAEEITNYSVDIQIQEDSTLEITEHITYDFEDARRHGIFRTIPVRYETDSGNRRIFVDDISVRQDNVQAQWETSRQGSALEIKIGDPDVEITGAHTYSISYTVRGALNFFDDGRAELYWDVVGDKWETEIAAAEAELSLPADVSEADVEYRCFVGQAGARDQCGQVDYVPGYLRVASEDGASLSPGEGVTVVLNFPAEIVEKPTTFASAWWWLRANPTVLLPLLIFFLSFYVWWHWGRDPEGRGTIVTQYEPPENLKPILVGGLIDETVHTRDITAGILYLAEQGFISIEREEKKWLLGSHDYVLRRERPLTEIEDPTYRHLAEALFSAQSGAASVSISELFSGAKKDQKDMKDEIRLSELKKSSDFQMVVQKMKKDVMQDMRDRGWFAPKNNILGWVFFSAIVVAIVLFQFGDGFGVVGALSIFVSVFILFGFSLLMKKKTKAGAILQEKLLGFKEFLAMTQKERLDFHNAPERSPEEFMQYLPYAVALEVEEKWAKQFAGLDMPPPRWYRSTGTFAASDFASDLSSFSDSYSQAASGSSGTSGGSAGGGMGGGGGGSW